MITKLQSEQPKLMYTITTPVSQIAKKALAGSGIPIVFAAVTDPVAAKLVPSWEAGDEGMTGASDLQDIAAILEFAKKLFPNAKRLGVPYNPGEANDAAIVEKIKAAAPPPVSRSCPSASITSTTSSSGSPRSPARRTDLCAGLQPDPAGDRRSFRGGPPGRDTDRQF